MDTPIRKLCVNCRFYLPGTKAEYDRCSHLDCSTVEPVRGSWTLGFCSIERIHRCGPEGKLFISKEILEPKEEDHV